MQNVERGRRIELLALAWKAKVLPLYEPRVEIYLSTNIGCKYKPMTKFYCASIHQNIRIESSTVTGLRILPCCTYKTSANYKTLNEYNTSNEIRQLKTATTWPVGCSNCNQQEQAGQTSYRMQANSALEHITGTRYEIFPSNICNLKCMMCSPSNSTALAQELGETELVKEFSITADILQILRQQNDIESISAIGGEFFLSKGNLDVMDFVIENNIPFRVVTNATVILPQHLERLQRIQNLELQISIDGINDSYEFMRYPALWDKFSNNVQQLLAALPSANINFHFVAQVLNIRFLAQTLEWCNQQKRPTRITSIVAPVHLGWSVFTPDEKQELINTLTVQLEHYRLTRQQKQWVRDLCNTLTHTEYNAQHRIQCDQQVTTTLTKRKISRVWWM